MNSGGRAAYMEVTRGDPNARREDGWLPRRAAFLRRVGRIEECLSRQRASLDRIEVEIDALREMPGEAENGV